MNRRRVWLHLWIALTVMLIVAACAGHTWATPGNLLMAILGHDSLESQLLIQWRLPRVVAAAIVGALLGLSGGIFQGVFRNPLAEPYLLGSAGGAALGATVALLVPISIPQPLSLPAFAFMGAWGATVAVLAIAKIAGRGLDVATLLLAGVAVAAILGALRSFLMLALSDETVSLQVVLSWVLGGMQTPSWEGVGWLSLSLAAALIVARFLASGLDLLGLGESMAASYGLSVSRFVAVAVLAGSGCVAASVTMGGLVGFVGLAAPHIARSLLGPLHRQLLPASALVGAVIVTVADAIARSALPPAEVPLGLITALAGAPLFIYVLARHTRK